MTVEITDRQLLQLIQGDMPADEERRLENLLSLDAELRARLDRLSGGDQWVVGSAPIPAPHHSARLSLAMEQVSRYVEDGTSSQDGSSVDTRPTQQELPTLVGITLLREIGRGGMGVVYEGIDDALGRRVAVKFIQPMRAASLEARERLVREAKATAALHHDNIVTIHAIQTADGTPALIQQYIDGSTLQQILDAEGALPIQRCISLAHQLAQGLAAAHAAGIIHRDLKPGNVLIDRATGKAMLVDFGMAKHIAELHLSSPDIVSGTPAYMSPEQTRGEQLDGRSDLFSLGAMLYTAITGQRPFAGDDPFVVMDQVRTAAHAPIATLRPDSPAWLNSTVDRLLAKSADDRFASAVDLLKILDASSNSVNSGRWSQRLAMVAACLLAIASAWYWWPTPNSPLDKAASTAVPNSQRPNVDSKPRIWNGEPSRGYETLVSAVKDAADGDVITIGSDLSTEQIDIVGKRLTFQAAEGTKPAIRPTEWAIEHSPFLFRADSDLVVKGLDIDWPVKTEPLSEPGATLSAVIAVTQSSATLLIEDCSIHRLQGICVAAAGNLDVQGCRLSGGKFGLGWLANNTHLNVKKCQLECESSLVVIFPPANSSFRETCTVHFEDCTSIGQGFVDFILFRHVEHAVAMDAKNCVFDVERMLQLSGTTIVANLNWDWVAQSVAKAAVQWRESDCTHRPNIEYIASRRIRGANRWMMGDVRGLEAWQNFWATKSNAESVIVNARVK